jgi:proteic killer suppression protein
VIKTFRHKGLKNLWNDGDASRSAAEMVPRIRRRLVFLHEAPSPAAMNITGFNFHELKGQRQGTFTIHVNGPYCITFGWDDGAIDVDFENYH